MIIVSYKQWHPKAGDKKKSMEKTGRSFIILKFCIILNSKRTISIFYNWLKWLDLIQYTVFIALVLIILCLVLHYLTLLSWSKIAIARLPKLVSDANVLRVWKNSQRSRMASQSEGTDEAVHSLIWLSMGTSTSKVISRAVIMRTNANTLK